MAHMMFAREEASKITKGDAKPSALHEDVCAQASQISCLPCPWTFPRNPGSEARRVCPHSTADVQDPSVCCLAHLTVVGKEQEPSM